MENKEKSRLVGYKQVPKRFFMIKTRKMFSLGSFEINDMTKFEPNTWWYSISFLFIEISWGTMATLEKEEERL